MSPLESLIVSIVLRGYPDATVGLNMMSNWSWEDVLDPNLKPKKRGSKNKNKQHLLHELVVINHNQQHGKENIQGGGQEVTAETVNCYCEHKQDGEETHHQRQIFAACV